MSAAISISMAVTRGKMPNRVDSIQRNDDNDHLVEIAECRKGLIRAGEQCAEDGGKQRCRRAICPAGADPERKACQHGERRCRGRPERNPAIAMHSGVPRCIEGEGERKLFWIAVVSNRQAQCVAILHDIDEVTELDHEAGRRDLAPAGIRDPAPAAFRQARLASNPLPRDSGSPQPASAQSLRRSSRDWPVSRLWSRASPCGPQSRRTAGAAPACAGAGAAGRARWTPKRRPHSRDDCRARRLRTLKRQGACVRCRAPDRRCRPVRTFAQSRPASASQVSA